MNEINVKVTVEAPALVEAIKALANAVNVVPPVQSAAAAVPAQQPAAATAPVQQPVAATAPVQQPVAAAVSAQQPTAAAVSAQQPVAATAPVQQPAINLDALSRAGAALIDKGMMQQVMALIQKRGVQAITQIPKEQYGELAAELRALGANI